jgi:hypothetical protein
METLNSAWKGINRGHMMFVLLLMAQFQLWDGVITHVFVRQGVAREANALMANLVYGGDFLFLKIVSVIILALVLCLLYRRFPKLSISTAAVVAIFYLGVITWNFLVVFANRI